MIEVRDVPGEKGLHGPAFICDRCGREIELIDGVDGVFLWDSRKPERIYFAHIGHCHDQLERLHELTSWHHLETFLAFLWNRYRYKDKEARKKGRHPRVPFYAGLR